MTTHGSNRIAFGTLVVTLISLVVLSGRVAANMLPVGGEFLVNTYTTGFQYGTVGRAVTRSPDGSFVVVWGSQGQDGSSGGVFGQRFDATGAPDGSEFRVNTYTTGFQFLPAASSAADGSFVVVWVSSQDGSNQSTHGQRYDSTGAPAGTEFQVNSYTMNNQSGPSVWAAADGRFVVTWTSFGQDGSAYGVFGQRFDATGAPDGTEFQVNSYTTSTQYYAAISGTADGSFTVVWTSFGQDGDDAGVHGQRYDATGSADGTEFQVNTYTSFGQYDPVISTAADGSFVVVWESYGQDGDNTSIQGRRFDSAGAPDGTEFVVNSYTTNSQYNPAVAADADGAFVVAWDSYTEDGNDTGVAARRFDADGTPDGNDFQVNTYTTGHQYYSQAVASDGAGNFVITWLSEGQDGTDPNGGTFAQLFCTDADADGNCDSRCSLVPATGCTAVTKAKLDVNEKKSGKEKLKIKWLKLVDATVQGDFGDPVAGTTGVSLCIYNDAAALAQEYVVDRAGDLCGNKDCWKAKSTKGYGYKDKDNSSDGISKVGFKSGAATKGKADAKGKNNVPKGQTSLPTGVVAKLAGNTAPTIQIVTSDGFCSTATMNDVKEDVTRYRAQFK